MAERRTHNRRRHRARVFVDFWNYTLLMRAIEVGFRTDWSQLGPVLAEAAVGRIDDGAGADYQGLSLYGSYDPRSEPDRRMHRWATGVVARFPGVGVSIVPRPKKRSPRSARTAMRKLRSVPVAGTT